ncbi:histidine--tRNA ligase [Micromonospora maritima]|uniref:histidine--tRNA ligase n=1 Tax=Micromonospora maritima TaxID=986711 RepID=UPI00157E005F|nr:HisS family protein [Micromonospora maritima]
MDVGIDGRRSALRPPIELPGFPEWSPAGVSLERRLIRAISEGFESHGFRPLDTAAVQPWSVLTAGDGQYSDGGVGKPIFRVAEPPETDTGASLGLRYDLTVPLARHIAERGDTLAFPLSCYQIAKVWRAEIPDLSHAREFYQCDLDVIGRGELSLFFDAEIACALHAAFEAVGLGDFTVRISNRRALAALLAVHGLHNTRVKAIVQIIDEGGRQPREKTVLQLRDAGVADAVAEDIGELLSLHTVREARDLFARRGADQGGLDELETVIDAAIGLGMPAGRLRLDFSITRGHDYYTGTVYETFVAGREHWGAIGSGGRYDNLLGHVTGERYPGVGVSIGLTRLVGLLLEDARAGGTAPDEVVVTRGPDAREGSLLDVVRELRRRGLPTRVLFDPPADPSVRADFATLVEVRGDGSCTVRHMPGGQVREVDAGSVAEVVASGRAS